ncbi:hypothetical protein L0337_05405 [candidate division KSB1 bacterium]|nr:hypothetical protein [candidate division KSB1 bacterium]
MKSKILLHQWRYTRLVLFAASILLLACGEEDNPLAPYQGQREMSGFVVDSVSHVPRMTWVGGYVSVLGVNRGSRAALDSSLVWLIRTDGNNIRFPVSFGQLPQNAQDLTGQYGGRKLDRLVEDNVYTYWLLKAEAWSQISANPNRPLVLDPNLTTTIAEVRRDTVFLSSMIHIQKTRPLDVFVNIRDVRSLGRLALISVQQPAVNPNPIIMWEIMQSGVTDSSIAVIGLINAQQYQESGKVWEVWSVDSTAGQTLFGSKNVIRTPLMIGQAFPETRVFVEFPAEGLERNRDYYLWIANKDWDRQGRLRSTNYYAYTTFRTW